MFTDTHCHIYKEYYESIDNVLENAKDVGINRVINNGCDNKSNKEVLELIDKFGNIYNARRLIFCTTKWFRSEIWTISFKYNIFIVYFFYYFF